MFFLFFYTLTHYIFHSQVDPTIFIPNIPTTMTARIPLKSSLENLPHEIFENILHLLILDNTKKADPKFKQKKQKQKKNGDSNSTTNGTTAKSAYNAKPKPFTKSRKAVGLNGLACLELMCVNKKLHHIVTNLVYRNIDLAATYTTPKGNMRFFVVDGPDITFIRYKFNLEVPQSALNVVEKLSLSTANYSKVNRENKLDGPEYLTNISELVSLLKPSCTPALKYFKLRFEMDGIKRELIPVVCEQLKRASKYIDERRRIDNGHTIDIHICASHVLLYHLSDQLDNQACSFWTNTKYLNVVVGPSTGTLYFRNFKMPNLEQVWVSEIYRSEYTQHHILTEGLPERKKAQHGKTLRVDSGVWKKIFLGNCFFPQVLACSTIALRVLSENNTPSSLANVVSLFLTEDHQHIYERGTISLPQLKFFGYSALDKKSISQSTDGIASFLKNNGKCLTEVFLDDPDIHTYSETFQALSEIDTLTQLTIFGSNASYVFETLARYGPLLSKLDTLKVSVKATEFRMVLVAAFAKTLQRLDHFPEFTLVLKDIKMYTNTRTGIIEPEKLVELDTSNSGSNKALAEFFNESHKKEVEELSTNRFDTLSIVNLLKKKTCFVYYGIDMERLATYI